MTPAPMDLTRTFPRSPRERIGGYAHLARMTDKARSKAAGTLGEYIYPCPLDEMLLEFLGVSSVAFSKAAGSCADDKLADWIALRALRRSPQETEDWNRRFLARKPRNEESLRRFLEIRGRIAPSRTDITTWPDLLDLEEGREVPLRTGDALPP